MEPAIGGRWGTPVSRCLRVGRYELLQPLGIGGMAEIIKARVSGPGGYERLLVIKRILPAYAQDPEFVQMFVSEAKLLGMIHHPNVVQVYDFGEADGTLFLALEFVDGPSVSRILRTLRAVGSEMPAAVAAYIAREIARALASVHNLRGADGRLLGVVHRDVSPSNIVLTTNGCAKLLDFGVAKAAATEQPTRAGTVKGKPAYLAPEQLEGRRIDGRVDLFALGVVLHEMLTLQHLFAAETDVAVAQKVLRMRIPAPSELRPDVPEALDRIVMRALARRRSRRYANAAEMARDLDEFVVSTRLRLDELIEFAAHVQALALHRLSHSQPAVAATASDRTVRDLRAPVIVSGVIGVLRRGFSGRSRRSYAITCAVVVLIALGLLFGWPALGRGGRTATDDARVTPNALVVQPAGRAVVPKGAPKATTAPAQADSTRRAEAQPPVPASGATPPHSPETH